MIDIITKYFPDLTSRQVERFARLKDLYGEWNEKINVISRKDIDSLYERHVLHSLGIAKYTQFANGTSVLDVGTGGGFPGIPLAILYPECNFTLVDSIGKKISVVNGVAESLGLMNVVGKHTRVQDLTDKYDFVVSRAVTAFPDFVKMVQARISTDQKNSISNGILYLKGGDFAEEIAPYAKCVIVTDLTSYFEESFFETKKIIHWFAI